jgi:hypothetical protein
MPVTANWTLGLTGAFRCHARRKSNKDAMMNDMVEDKTNTDTFEMGGKCPFGGDRVGGALGTPPALSDWYPDRLKVELLHQNGPSITVVIGV